MPEKNRLLVLDALRGFAAVAVVIFHFTFETPHENFLTSMGFMGVDLFFLISGFVISMTLEKCRSPKEFLLKRIVRLYPAYWFCLLFTSVALLVFGFEKLTAGFIGQFLVNTTMFQQIFWVPSIDGVYWTLEVEVIFYLLMFGLYATRRQFHLYRYGTIFLTFLSILGILVRFYPSSIYYLRYVNGTMPFIHFFPLLFAGILFYDLMFKGSSRVRYLLLLFCFATVIVSTSWDLRLLTTGARAYTIILLFFFAIFFLFIHNRLGLLVNRATLFLGTISYPLYLVHMKIGRLKVLPVLNRYMSFKYAFCVTILFVILLAYMIHLFVEKPFSAYLRRKILSK